MKRSFKFSIQTIREESRVLRTYLRRYRKEVVVGIAALIVVDFLDIFPPLLLKYTVDAATETRTRSSILWAAFAYGFVTLIQGAGRYIWRMFLIRASMWSGRDMRDRFAEKLFQLSARFFLIKIVSEI
jgi:ATP-binding cassette subfamily B protein